MKKTFCLLTLFFLITGFGFSQSPTTLDEYTFVIVGYKQSLNLKLEMKKGYSLKDIDSYIDEDRRLEFKALYRDSEKNPCAVMMIYYLPKGAAPLYYCIPTNNASAEIWDKFYKDMSTGDDNPEKRYRFFALSISKIMMKLAGEEKK